MTNPLSIVLLSIQFKLIRVLDATEAAKFDGSASAMLTEDPVESYTIAAKRLLRGSRATVALMPVPSLTLDHWLKTFVASLTERVFRSKYAICAYPLLGANERARSEPL